ncbi:peptide chain release factor 2 [Nitrospirota bacterium]
MQYDEIRDKIIQLEKNLQTIRGYLDVSAIQSDIENIDKKLSKEENWSSHEKMQELQQEKSQLTVTLEPMLNAENKLEYLMESANILDEEDGEMFLDEIVTGIKELEDSLENIEIRTLLSDPLDKNNAILTVNPGAGGTESQDWAQMLLRMYLRWAEEHGFKVDIVDLQQADEAGIKGATITISGPYAYGYLKVEAGVHRLVRISPFDTNKRRHTSFSAVLIYPEIKGDMDIGINEDDIRVDTFRASGAGGQHVNKTDSAIRITHQPSGIVVSCQSDRSQHRNRDTAMNILKARLYDLQIKKNEKEMRNVVGEKKDIAWGSQIRSYVLHPYKMIKDHRTGESVGNVDSVLNGNIDVFIKSVLKDKARGN